MYPESGRLSDCSRRMHLLRLFLEAHNYLCRRGSGLEFLRSSSEGLEAPILALGSGVSSGHGRRVYLGRVVLPEARSQCKSIESTEYRFGFRLRRERAY